jgi:hypothetical protein
MHFTFILVSEKVSVQSSGTHIRIPGGSWHIGLNGSYSVYGWADDGHDVDSNGSYPYHILPHGKQFHMHTIGF